MRVKENGLPEPKSDTAHTLMALILNRSLNSIQLRKITKSSYPPARCADVVKLGISLITTREKYRNRRGEVSSIARYTIATPMKTAKEIYLNLCNG